jgi:hypothetical protein
MLVPLGRFSLASDAARLDPSAHTTPAGGGV